MKKNKIRGTLLILALLAAVGYSAFGATFFIEAKGSVFIPTDKVFRDIYGQGMSFGGEIIVSLWEGIGLWIGGDYFSKKGKLTLSKEDTSIQITPVYGGLKWQLLRGKFRPYIGGGCGILHLQGIERHGNLPEVGSRISGTVGFSVFSFKVFFYRSPGKLQLLQVQEHRV
jgi:hypothetical protein